VVVFAPGILLTITLEAGTAENEELHMHAGGQGFWVTRMVNGLGIPVTLCAPFGGETGRVLLELVEAEDVMVDAVAVSESNGSYVHDRRGGKRDVIAEINGGKLKRHEVDDLYDAALVAGLDAGIVVLTGQPSEPLVPPDMYRRLSVDLRANGCRVVADLSGETLEEAMAGGVDLLKISDEELRASHFARGESDGLRDLLGRLQEAGAENVVISRAEKPAVARLGDETLEVVVPRIEPLDFRGAGDSMTAGLATGLALGFSLKESLRLAAAAGSLNVTRHGLGTGRRKDIERLANHVEIREFVG
jgi:1-phosphofructokinase